jgi:hypothetical protein
MCSLVLTRHISRCDVDSPAWDVRLYARCHLVENASCRMKDYARLALRRNKTRHDCLSFAHLAATLINLRLANFGYRP